MNTAVFNYDRDIAPLTYFAGRICHDLNNLITSSMGATSLLELKLSPLAKQSVDAEITRLHNSLHHYRTFTQRLSQIFFDISEGKMLLTMNLILTSACEGIDRPVNIELLPTPLKSNVDAALLAIAIREIIVNAVEACPDNEPITVSLAECQIDGKNMIRFQCIDKGKGIKAEHMPDIFTPFFSKGKRGNLVGLGLAQAGNVIHQHHGELIMHSEEGVGTTVEFTIEAADI